MKIPVSWLREYVRVDATTAQIAEALSVGAAEVDGVERVGLPGELGLFRVGHVLEAAKHPDADRLQLTSVDVGEDRPVLDRLRRLELRRRARRSRSRCPARRCRTG